VLVCICKVKESPSPWENPLSATTSWKPCAERRIGGISDLPPENETNGYVFIHAEGGLNQQRIAVCIFQLLSLFLLAIIQSWINV
jgi:hypothetical protein